MSGDLDAAAAEARQAASLPTEKSSGWSVKLLLQRARIEIYRGDSKAALTLLEPPLPAETQDSTASAMRASLLAIACARTGDLHRAQLLVQQADAAAVDVATRSQFLLAKVAVALEQGDLVTAEEAASQALAHSRVSADKFLQTQALLNIGVAELRQDHYEDALRHFQQASAVAKEIGAHQAQMKAEGNTGSMYYKIGDFPHSLANAQEAVRLAHTLGSPIDESGLLFDAGMSQYQMGDLPAARHSFQASYEIARTIQNNEEIGQALAALASLALHDGDVQGALAGAREAEQVADRSGNSKNRVQPAILEARVLAREGQLDIAGHSLTALLHGKDGSLPRPFERWQIESELAKLAARCGDRSTAKIWFDRAIGTFRLQRQSLTSIDSRLPFIENGNSLYMDYMQELVRENKPGDALRVLDQSRAETLAEGNAGEGGHVASEGWADPRNIAQRLHGTILVYCLQQENSYVWAITPKDILFVRLAGRETILPLVASHTREILSGRDVLASQEAPGAALYGELIAPVQSTITSRGKVFVMTDGELSHLNFETLIAPGDKPHFWIEDVNVVNAKSLALLAARNATARNAKRPKELLLVGDPQYRTAEYVLLPHAADEVTDVRGHFAEAQSTVLTGAQATRSGYMASHPGDFRYIHFTAHATASEVNPLDSAVVLSAQQESPDSYKLYARDIMNSRIRADLVTISACFGSGVRTYSGEGLVGLAWAFLHAGSHNVVGALWEVSDASTPRLMGDLYTGLVEGHSPDVALRQAKLAMIARGGAFRKPFYWAAFQLYSGA